MVRAILDGSKTQTRRIVKPQPLHNPALLLKQYRSEDSRASCYWPDDEGDDKGGHSSANFGWAGSRLWVRETWNRAERTGYDAAPQDGRPGFDESDPDAYNFGPCWFRATDEVIVEGGWKPSIFMPRAASRITLEIVSVRVERLQDISEEDAKTEGVTSAMIDAVTKTVDDITNWPQSAWVAGYRYLWEKINGPGSWDANPWVWVVEFKKVEVAS
jgi:hypothetical protein